MAGRSTIVLFNESLFNSYTRRIWSGVESQARSLGYRTITLCGTLHHRVHRGQTLPEGLDDSRSNLLTECFRFEGSTGYLFWSAMLNHGATQAEVADVLRQERGGPVVSLGMEAEGIPSLVADNHSAMAKVVRHLIERHGCRRLLYIAGNDSTDQVEIQQRYQAYTDTLTSFALPLDEKLVILPDVLAEPVAEAPAEDGYRPFFRYTPVGDRICRIVFEERGLEPLRDFDGIVCRDDWTALEVLRALARRGVTVGAHLPLMGFDDAPEGEESRPSLSTVRQDLEAHGAAACRHLVGLIEGTATPKPPRLPEFPLILRESCGCLAEPPPRYSHRVETVDYPGLLESCMGVVSTFDLEELLEQLPSQLERLGVSGLYLVLFDDPKDPWGTATLRYGQSDGKPLAAQPGWASFSVADLLPGDCLNRTQNMDLIVEVLHFGQHRMGYAVFESGGAPGIAYYTVKSMLATALQGALLIEENRRKLAIIESKSQELDRAHAQLLLQEKQAALGALVAGVAHEINTPLGIAVTTVSMMNDLVEGLLRSPAAQTTEPRSVTDTLTDVAEAGRLAMRGLERADQLVQNFKQVSADQAHEVRREFRLKEYLAAVLRTIEYRWRETAIEVSLVGADELTLDSFAGPVGRVVSELVLNALDHGFTAGETGSVVVTVAGGPDGWALLTCVDSGQGISDLNQKRLFEPFFTTRRAQGGTGLGLHIVFNLVHQVLGGTIEVESRPVSRHTCFLVRLPLRAPTIQVTSTGS